MSSAPAPRPADAGQARLVALASRLYHVHGLRQRDVATRLGTSQAKVSRLLQQAVDSGLVRTVVLPPEGIDVELEEAIEQRYGVSEVHVVRPVTARDDLAALLGRAAARHLGELGVAGDVVGFTSWSTTLQHLAHELPAAARAGRRQVVEMLGDLGSPARQHAAARATQGIARALSAEPVFLRTPGVVTSPVLRDRALADAHVARALELLDRLDTAFVGVGPVALHSALEEGDRFFTSAQLEAARAAGAAAQLNQRLLDASGHPLATPLDELVVGSTLEQVARAGRRVVVAGGPEKHGPIAAALAGRWVDVLVTDTATALTLAAGEAPAPGRDPLPRPRVIR